MPSQQATERALHATTGLALIGMFAALAALGSVLLGLGDPWDPIGEFPVQDVTEINEDFVHVVGTKCYDEDVSVRGEFGWQRVEPPGFAITLGAGQAEREEGCLTQEFNNDIPDEVREANTPGAVWRIVGEEVPFDEDREGLPRSWRTEDFVLP